MTVYYVSDSEQQFEKCFNSENIREKLTKYAQDLVNWYNEGCDPDDGCYAMSLTDNDITKLLEEGDCEILQRNGMFVDYILIKKLIVE